MPAVIAFREQLMASMSSAISEISAAIRVNALGKHAAIAIAIGIAIDRDIVEKHTIRMRRLTPTPMMVMATIGG